MFDLNQAIGEWRQQMLAAGIQSPVPLEELESHLRETIEQLMKSGLNEPEAFRTGIQKTGQGCILQDEFEKVRKDGQLKRTSQQIIRSIALIIGWLAAGLLLLYGLISLEFDWNFFSFQIKWNWGPLFAVLIILVGETGLWFLAMVNRDRGSRIVSLLGSLFLAGIGVSLFVEIERGIFGGPREIPLWYRSGRTMVLCLPGIFWAWWELRRFAQGRGPSREDQPIRSN